MVDKLQEQDNNNREPIPDQQLADVITSHNPGKKNVLLVKEESGCGFCGLLEFEGSWKPFSVEG